MKILALVLQGLMIPEHHIRDRVRSSYRGSHLATLRSWHHQWLWCRTQILCLLAEVFPTSLMGAYCPALNTVPWRRCPHMWPLAKCLSAETRLWPHPIPSSGILPKHAPPLSAEVSSSEQPWSAEALDWWGSERFWPTSSPFRFSSVYVNLTFWF